MWCARPASGEVQMAYAMASKNLNTASSGTLISLTHEPHQADEALTGILTASGSLMRLVHSSANFNFRFENLGS